MIPVARLGNVSTSDPCGAPPRPNSQGSSDVFTNSLPTHRVSDSWVPHACPDSTPHGATTVVGSGTVFVNNLAITRIGDPISCGSSIAEGSDDVFAG